MNDALPPKLQATLKRAERLEWWTIGLIATVIAVMGLAMGSSQVMKTAWIEDCLSLTAPIVFLMAARVERHRPTSRFPNGFARAPGLAFAIAAAALAVLGGVLLVESVMSLAAREHATVGGVVILGREVWLGWVMVAAQLYSIAVPVVLGRLKLPLARELNDKTLFTDAQTQKADWMTGVAGIGGVIGIGLGWWWADALAAGVISLGILHDGVRALRSASAELIDGAPRELDGVDVAADANALHASMSARFPGAEIHLRELGRVIAVQVVGAVPPGATLDPADYWPGDPARSWRLGHVGFVPPRPEGG
ncbi:MAG: cation diffusion facilitator family transporter [Sphingomonas bacterium]|uniref:cation transporter n=1 Tax=Sphingomonas bacterium TaxID=1895847 RepID=UPI00261E2859|nr:cation transporter [Sphingomonas bacterium]MDB5695408.1 cation diffusion facilitator family transporter [Sphingomonas bacterium]